jgi:tetratricopeptide (TPR) repeat protein
VELGYAAFERGDLDTARDNYQSALVKDPLNRDALLGLAAIDVRTQQYASAEARYLKLLERDPRDAYAHAGLIGLRGRGDPVATESRIKNLLAQQPESNVLQFTLGNQYAAGGRWPEAQQAYFKAYAADPANADYAFNLAVSLDHLRQPRLAAEYYRKAIALSGTRPGAFDPAQAEARLRQLEP